MAAHGSPAAIAAAAAAADKTEVEAEADTRDAQKELGQGVGLVPGVFRIKRGSR